MDGRDEPGHDQQPVRSARVSTFKAIVINKTEAGQTVRLTDFDEKDLMEGDVTFASNGRR